jgi:HAE1 family hydrophobic/amphiphilic exporter-1
MVNINGEKGKTVKEINIVYHIQGQQKLADVSKLVDEMEQYLYDNQQAFEFTQVNSRIWSDFAMSRIKFKNTL